MDENQSPKKDVWARHAERYKVESDELMPSELPKPVRGKFRNLHQKKAWQDRKARERVEKFDSLGAFLDRELIDGVVNPCPRLRNVWAKK